jgi:hypothetical protein
MFGMLAGIPPVLQGEYLRKFPLRTTFPLIFICFSKVIAFSYPFMVRSEGICPGLSITEGFLLLQTGSYLGKLLIVKTDFELLGHVFVLVLVGLVVLAPFRVLDVLLHQDALLDEFGVLIGVGERVVLEVFEVLFEVGSGICSEATSIDDIPGGLLGLLAVDGGKFMHFLEMLLQDLPFKGSDITQVFSWISSPNFTLLDLHVVGNDGTCSHEASGLHGGMSNCCSHRYKSTIMQIGALKDRIGADKDVIPDGGTPRNMDSILDNGVVSNANWSCSKDGGSIPNRGIGSHNNIPENGGIGCNKRGFLEFWLLPFIDKSTQTGRNSILTQPLPLEFIPNFVEPLTSGP